MTGIHRIAGAAFALAAGIGLLATPPSAANDGPWRPVTLAEVPGPFQVPPLLYDSARQRMIALYGTTSLWSLELGNMQWTRTAIPALVSHTIDAGVYDPAGDRLLVLAREGSMTPMQIMQLPLGVPNPTWSLLSTSGFPPQFRTQAAVMVDPRTNRLVLFGGWKLTGGWLDDTWALSLTGTPTWSLMPTGPPARAYGRSIYDPVRQRMVLFSGEGNNYQPLQDVWSLALTGFPNWIQLSAGGGPSARRGGAAVYDAPGDRMIAFGGQTTSGNTDDLWAFDFSTTSWAPVASAVHPGGRREFGAAFDPETRRLVVFGGHVSPQLYPASNDLWVRSLEPGGEWVQARSNQPLLGPKGDVALVWDPLRQRPMFFGTGEIRAFERDRVEWTHLGTQDERSGSSVIWDPVRDRMVIFGGERGSSLLRDVLTWSHESGNALTLSPPLGPSARKYAAGAYDPVRDRALFFAGYPVYSARNQVWSLPLGAASPTWTELTPAGTAPTQRYGHTMTYDPVRDRMIVFGGGDGIFTNELWALSLAGGGQWTKLVGPGTPPAGRSFHSAIYDPLGDRLIVSGGRGVGSAFFSDTWEYQLGGGGWRQLDPGDGPPPQQSSAVYDPELRRMVMYGWQNAAGPQANTWTLELPGQTVGVPGPTTFAPGFQLLGAMPNPAMGAPRIAFTLPPDFGPVRLELVDLSGRRVAVEELADPIAGRHVVDLAAGKAIAPGLYFARLSGGGRSLTAKVCVAR